MIDVAIEAAKAAGDLAYGYFRTNPKVNYKKDNSPVTVADIEAEKLIRKIISKKFPDHALFGEEFPPVNPKSRFKWVIDPIDGTRDYVRQIPSWATLIALLDGDFPILGVAFYPSTDEFFWAKRHKGTFLNGKKTKVSGVSSIEKSVVLHSSINRLRNLNVLDKVANLCDLCQGKRNHGSYNWALLLKGDADVVIETGQIHDFAAPALLIDEAGGKFTDFSGRFSITSGNAVATNGILHSQVLKILNQKSS